MHDVAWACLHHTLEQHLLHAVGRPEEGTAAPGGGGGIGSRWRLLKSPVELRYDRKPCWALTRAPGDGDCWYGRLLLSVETRHVLSLPLQLSSAFHDIRPCCGHRLGWEDEVMGVVDPGFVNACRNQLLGITVLKDCRTLF